MLVGWSKHLSRHLKFPQETSSLYVILESRQRFLGVCIRYPLLWTSRKFLDIQISEMQIVGRLPPNSLEILLQS